jgi:hypothetical protein
VPALDALLRSSRPAIERVLAAVDLPAVVNADSVLILSAHRLLTERTDVDVWIASNDRFRDYAVASFERAPGYLATVFRREAGKTPVLRSPPDFAPAPSVEPRSKTTGEGFNVHAPHPRYPGWEVVCSASRCPSTELMLPGSMDGSSDPVGPPAGVVNPDGTVLLWALAEHFTAERRAEILQRLVPDDGRGRRPVRCPYSGCDGNVSLRERTVPVLLATPVEGSSQSVLIELAWSLIDLKTSIALRALTMSSEGEMVVERSTVSGRTWRERLDGLRWRVDVPSHVPYLSPAPVRHANMNTFSLDARGSLRLRTPGGAIGLRIARAR